jgi:predicted ATPase
LLTMLPDSAERTMRELDLRTRLGPILMALRGYGSVEAEQEYERAKELCQRVGERPHLFPVLWGLWLVHSTRGEFETARGLGEECGEQLKMSACSENVTSCWVLHFMQPSGAGLGWLGSQGFGVGRGSDV